MILYANRQESTRLKNIVLSNFFWMIKKFKRAISRRKIMLKKLLRM